VADKFTFTAGDPMVVKHLSADEIGKVPKWQESEEYTFEFHDQHTQNWPVYIRPVGNTDTDHVPKIITMNHKAENYKTINAIYNCKKLHDELSAAARKEIEEIIRKSWSYLAKLTENFWTGKPVNATQQARPTYRCLSCNAQFFGTLKGPQKGKFHKCTQCYQFQVVSTR
jgi:DNA-directed RNA polymerase subunit RPC12/RpoP